MKRLSWTSELYKFFGWMLTSCSFSERFSQLHFVVTSAILATPRVIEIKISERLKATLPIIGILVLITPLTIYVLTHVIYQGFGDKKLQQTNDGSSNEEQIDITIPKFGCKDDIGGWKFPSKIFRPAIDLIASEKPEYGGLDFQSVAGASRSIKQKDSELYEIYRKSIVERRDKNLDEFIQREDYYSEELEDRFQRCQRFNWFMDYNPICNTIHELDMGSDYKPNGVKLGADETVDSFLISSGLYRNVWVVDQVEDDIKSVMKTLRWEHAFSPKNVNSILRDALIMERLTHSPRIIDIYAHCSTSIWAEALPYEVEEYIISGTGYTRGVDLKDENEVKPQNVYTAEEKLTMATEMAEGLAELHGFKDGLIVHDDVQLSQWLRTKEGKLKLGDFNRAELPLFNPSKEEYCKYTNGPAFGNYRSPEEYFGYEPIDEKIDVYSMGNNIYALLTGLWVFSEIEDDQVVQDEVMAGKQPYVDARYMKRSFIENKLVEIMQRCWAFDPAVRPEIFEVVRFLKAVGSENGKIDSAGMEST